MQPCEAPVGGRLGRGRLQAARQLSQRQRRILRAELGDLAQLGCELVEAPVGLEPANRPELLLGGAARADDVGVVRVREPVRTRARRGDDRALLEAQRSLVRAEEGEELRDRVGRLRVRDSVAPAVVHGELEPFGGRERSEMLGAFDIRGP